LAITDAPEASETGAAGVSTAGVAVAGWETTGELAGAPGADGWANAAVPIAAAVTIPSTTAARRRTNNTMILLTNFGIPMGPVTLGFAHLPV
jgi:hypothetical protein